MLRIAKLHVRFATFPARLVINNIAQKRATKRSSKTMLKNYEVRLQAAIDNVKTSQLALTASN